MRYWWVNQNQTYRAEVRGSFMWSPKLKADGTRNQFYENMREVSPGDIVFSFCDTRIKAVGVVTGGAQTGPKPDFGNAGLNWSKEGWFVPVDYCILNNQIRPKDHAAILRPFLPAKYSPLQESGDGLQSVYLAEVPEPLTNALIGLIGQAYWDATRPPRTCKTSTATCVAVSRNVISMRSPRTGGCSRPCAPPCSRLLIRRGAVPATRA